MSHDLLYHNPNTEIGGIVITLIPPLTTPLPTKLPHMTFLGHTAGAHQCKGQYTAVEQSYKYISSRSKGRLKVLAGHYSGTLKMWTR